MMEIVLLKGLLFAGGILLVLWLLTILQARWTKEAYDFKDKVRTMQRFARLCACVCVCVCVHACQLTDD